MTDGEPISRAGAGEQGHEKRRRRRTHVGTLTRKIVARAQAQQRGERQAQTEKRQAAVGEPVREDDAGPGEVHGVNR